MGIKIEAVTLVSCVSEGIAILADGGTGRYLYPVLGLTALTLVSSLVAGAMEVRERRKGSESEHAVVTSGELFAGRGSDQDAA